MWRGRLVHAQVLHHQGHQRSVRTSGFSFSYWSIFSFLKNITFFCDRSSSLRFSPSLGTVNFILESSTSISNGTMISLEWLLYLVLNSVMAMVTIPHRFRQAVFQLDGLRLGNGAVHHFQEIHKGVFFFGCDAEHIHIGNRGVYYG
jgi:hypothetical protein